MNIGTPLTRYDYGDPDGMFTDVISDILGEDWGDLRDIEILTLKQHQYDRASEQAWRICGDVNKVDQVIESLLRHEFRYAREFVTVEEDKFVIGVNAPKINKKSIKHAFDLLSNIREIDVRRTIEFGERVKVNEATVQ